MSGGDEEKGGGSSENQKELDASFGQQLNGGVADSANESSVNDSQPPEFSDIADAMPAKRSRDENLSEVPYQDTANDEGVESAKKARWEQQTSEGAEAATTANDEPKNDEETDECRNEVKEIQHKVDKVDQGEPEATDKDVSETRTEDADSAAPQVPSEAPNSDDQPAQVPAAYPDNSPTV